ncbi:hypothetical protein [Paenibacillus macquariensis]|uniref:Uncharacterized protein n=1 Tax=Paenibacillus macquariensis TaxID=948756 RepID=A0ABY1JV99_9BACL|nr:hypothetical protein [Paenibacillus macquariensis]MEC0090788.1 hypothetical protein [Paenibacillus macquariensis]OAB34528.1 hypothetical protein PMSM_11735 [Paenibacillus macquariensis subsp. macquariensis]SIQ83764.1 hypothetical protein SAMN05421578_104280 [Paenibacillus macquariensis]
MKVIDFSLIKDRLINGMYWVENIHNPKMTDQDDTNGSCFIWHPKGYLIKSALDYLKYLHGNLLRETTIGNMHLPYVKNITFKVTRIEGATELTGQVLIGFIK